MEGVTEMLSVMYDLIMKVTNEINSEMEVSTINETYDASTMMFATDCIRSSNFRGMCTEASK